MCEVTLLMSGTTVNCIPHTNSTITFSVTNLFFNQLLSVNVTLSNARISTVSQVIISKYRYSSYIAS